MNYSITWKQPYTNWVKSAQQSPEVDLSSNDLKEAREVLARIMAL